MRSGSAGLVGATGLAIAVALLMVASSGAYSVTQETSTSVASHSPSLSLPANQPGTPGGPLVVPGNYVTLTCTDGVISVGGDTCSNQAKTIDMCDTSPSCVYTAYGSALSGYGFGEWTVGGSAGLTGSSDFNATLTVYVVNPALRYSSTLTLTVGTGELVSGTVYVNESVPTSVATIQIAGWDLTNGQSIYLGNGYSLPISATDFKDSGDSSYAFSQWATNAGTLGSPTAESTTLDVSGAGTLDLIASLGPPGNWGGYVTSGTDLTSVSGTIDMPTCLGSCPGDPAPATYNVSFWVGLGGSYSGAALWQAGVALSQTVSNSEPTVTTMTPFFEAVGGTCSSSTYGCNPQYAPLSFVVSLGDTVIVNISTSGGNSLFSIKDTTDGDSWTGTDYSFTPNTHTAEWVGEIVPIPLLGFNSTTFTHLITNGNDVTLGQSPVVALLAGESTYYITPSYVTAADGSAGFYLLDSSVRGDAP